MERRTLSSIAEATMATALRQSARPCITCSFQLDGMVVLHMLRNVRPDIPVLFIDTVHHFAATYAFRDRMAREWRLNLIEVRAGEPSAGRWQDSTDACCRRHKVEPLFAALEDYDTWFTGLRREQSPSRAAINELERFALPTGTTLAKVNPLARWTTKDVWAYARAHDIDASPLYALGYTSIGCEPCTTPPIDPNNPRSGRWQGQKLECGIHVSPGGRG